MPCSATEQSGCFALLFDFQSPQVRWCPTLTIHSMRNVERLTFAAKINLYMGDDAVAMIHNRGVVHHVPQDDAISDVKTR
jgi:hypothetical protein